MFFQDPLLIEIVSIVPRWQHYHLNSMPPSFKRKRHSSTTSVASRTSRPPSSQHSTPLVSFKRPSLDAQPQPQRKRATSGSQPILQRAASSSRVPLSQDDELSVLANGDDADETLDNVVMAVDIKERGIVGCAYYVAREERLFCMEEIVNGGKDIVETCN
jgi:DNA mismatch repair protein MSH5